MFWGKLSITWRLSLGFGLVIVLLVVVAFTSVMGLRKFNADVDDFATVHVPTLINASALVDSLLQSSREMRQILILDDEKQIKAALAAVQKGSAQRRELREQLQTMLEGAKEKELLKAIVEASGKYAPHEEEFIKVVGRGDYSTAKDIMLERVAPAQKEYQQAISTFSEYQIEQTRAEARHASGSYTTTVAVVVGLALLAVVVAVGAAWLIVKSLVSQLRQTATVLEGVAAGDFTQRLEVTGHDELGRLAASLNQAVEGMSGALRDISAASDQAADASRHVSEASRELSSGTQAQASSLEESAASLEEITGTIKQNADNARQASQLAAGSRDAAEKGGRVAADAVQAMAEINQASKKIADITTTIDEIAFQTNLLALNAAVEAARAGEQGRGFAVVAAEVRNLAQRSAVAAKEIKALIQDSVQKIQDGSELVNTSGQSLNEIVVAVKRVTDIIAEIAAASAEQTSGIDQVNRAVGQIDQVMQGNATRTEELSSTANAMASQAEQLQALVARFKLAEEHHDRRRPAERTYERRVPTPIIASAPAMPKPAMPVPEPVLVGANGHAKSGHSTNGHAARPKDDGFEEF